jgi:hypothetical protein
MLHWQVQPGDYQQRGKCPAFPPSTRAVWEARKDISLEELRVALIEHGLHVSVTGLHRFFVRHDMTGSIASSISIPNGSCSSMKLGLPPT